MMKSWLPYLVSELSGGGEPVLAQTLNGRDVRAAVLDRSGEVLAGDWRGTGLFRGARKFIVDMLPGEPLVAVAQGRRFLLEKQAGPASLAFWKEALEGQEEAWAAWLLTLATSRGEGDLKVARHILSACGPWTAPRLPGDEGEWSLLPLNAGLGRLFVFGDDDLALETAALGGRIGLKVTLVTVKPREAEAEGLRAIGAFNLLSFPDWKRLDPEAVSMLGLRTGVLILVTAADNEGFLPEIEKVEAGWLGLAGAAAPPGSEPGLFPMALTPAQKALGLITEMLGPGGPRT
ncbi:MAG: hypothetical protein LBG06_02275 [Deltaproteobacteria bacterium]|jgi:hypothetical protein|nr:hypothetical protein [Deltaproteobacteria bacterium]